MITRQAIWTSMTGRGMELFDRPQFPPLMSEKSPALPTFRTTRIKAGDGRQPKKLGAMAPLQLPSAVSYLDAVSTHLWPGTPGYMSARELSEHKPRFLVVLDGFIGNELRARGIDDAHFSVERHEAPTHPPSRA